MCGLVGVLTTSKRALNPSEKNMFKLMLRFDVIRGEHSTGIIGVDREEGNATIYKHMGCPTKEKTFTSNNGKNPIFTDNGDFKKPLRALFGHNRFATTGKLNVDNAHPFIAGNLVGMHNGTVKEYILKRIEEENPYGTDSEFIYNKINENGLEATIKELDGGAWCLTYYDFVNKTYNFLRNKERPLWIAWDKLGTMAWASEKWMIEVAADKCFWKFDNLDMLLEDTHLQISEDGVVEKEEVKAEYRWMFPRQANTYIPSKTTHAIPSKSTEAAKKLNKSNIMAMKGKEVELSPLHIKTEYGHDFVECHLEGWLDENVKEPVPWCDVRIYLKKGDKNLREWAKAPYDNEGNFEYFSVKVKDIKYKADGKPYAIGDRRTIEGPYVYEVVSNNRTVKGYGGTIFYEEEFNNKVKCGCSHCLQVPKFEDGNNVLWVDPTTFLCDECVNSNVPNQYGIDSNIIYM